MKTDDEVIGLIDEALVRVSAPIDELMDGALNEARRLTGRRRVYAGIGVAAVAATVSAAVAVGTLASTGRDGSAGTVGQPSTTSQDAADDAATTPRMRQMLALLDDLSPGHDYSGLDLQFENENGIELMGTVDGAWFQVFVQAPGQITTGVERDLVDCTRRYSVPDAAPDEPFCRGGFRSYPDGTSRLLLRAVGGDLGEAGLDRPVINNTALVFFPDQASTGAVASNAPRIAAPPAPIMDVPPFTLDELEQMMADPRWNELVGPNASIGSSGKN